MDTKIAYDWLRVWVDAKHPSFQNCTINTSDSVRDGLKLITEKIIDLNQTQCFKTQSKLPSMMQAHI